MLRDSVPFPTPVAAVRSDDDKLHAHWLFARDQRRCAGVAVVRVFDPVDVALPKLLRSGRRPEALKRVAAARGTGARADTSFTLLANDWLSPTQYNCQLMVKSGFKDYNAGRKQIFTSRFSAGTAGLRYKTTSYPLPSRPNRHGRALPNLQGVMHRCAK